MEQPLMVKGPEGGHTILRNMRKRDLVGPVRNLLRRSQRVTSAKTRLFDIVQERFPFLSIERHEPGSYVPGEVLVRYTFRCNQRCPYCSAPRPTRDPSPRELELSFRAAARLFAGAQFTITGGEPTLRKELPAHVRLLLDMKRFSQIRVQTNAIAFAKASYLRRYRPDPELVFFVSFRTFDPILYDELTGTQGMLAAAVSGLQSLIEADHRVIINFVINNKNVEHLEEYSRRLGWMIGANDKVSVHFSSLTCPEHRPAAASYLVRYGQLIPRSLKAMRCLKKMGIAVQSPLSPTHASFPLCAVPEMLRREKVKQYRPLEHETGYEDFSKAYVKSMSCRTCALASGCLGLPREYADRFGLGECRPISADKSTTNLPEATRSALQRADS
jgi:uncharacterized Fe-S cluster-containing radical SAM superfamily protein